MKIGLFSREFHSPHRRGIAIYSHELAKALSSLLQEAEVSLLDYFWSRTGLSHLPELNNPNFSTHVMRCPGRVFDALNRAFDWPTLETIGGSMDLLHVMHEDFPSTRTRNIVITIHGAGPLTHPQMFLKHFRERWIEALDRGLERASGIVCVSDSLKQQLARFRPAFASKYRSVSLGVSEKFLDEPDPPREKGFLISKGIDFPYVLYVGAADPGKNLPALLSAFVTVLRDEGPLPQRLVLAGHEHWGGYADLREFIEGLSLGDRVHLLGYVDHDELPALYRGCDLFVFPALFEGFGLPLLEAMASGAACLVSRRPALDEVGGNAVEYFDADSVEDISAKLGNLLIDPGRLATMRTEARTRAGQFTWHEAAKKTIQVYEDVLGASLL